MAVSVQVSRSTPTSRVYRNTEGSKETCIL